MHKHSGTDLLTSSNANFTPTCPCRRPILLKHHQDKHYSHAWLTPEAHIKGASLGNSSVIGKSLVAFASMNHVLVCQVKLTQECTSGTSRCIAQFLIVPSLVLTVMPQASTTWVEIGRTQQTDSAPAVYAKQASIELLSMLSRRFADHQSIIQTYLHRLAQVWLEI